MEKIYFAKNYWIDSVLIIGSLVLFIIAFFNLSEYSFYLIIIGGFVLMTSQSVPFWFKNYISCNNKTVYLKFNKRKGYKIKFRTIDNVVFKDYFFVITLVDGNRIVVDTTNICLNDIEILKEIFGNSNVFDGFRKPVESIV